MDIVAAIQLVLISRLAREVAEAAEILDVDGSGHHLTATRLTWSKVETRGQGLLDRTRTIERRLLCTGASCSDLMQPLFGHAAEDVVRTWSSRLH